MDQNRMHWTDAQAWRNLETGETVSAAVLIERSRPISPHESAIALQCHIRRSHGRQFHVAQIAQLLRKERVTT
jgi:hypothetical protein